MSSSLLIKNVRLVNEDTLSEVDILIKNGRFEKIAGQIDAKDSYQIIDAEGLTALPGMIDSQVHFREPGLTHKGNLATESRAAVAGGITGFFDMPNTIPNALSSDVLEEKFVRAAEVSIANYSFYHGASNDNLEHIKRMDPKASCGVKVFMGASTGNMLVDDRETLEGIFQHAPTLIATHCEHTPSITANEDAMREKYGDDVPMELHPLIRSEAACYKSSSLAVELANQFNSRLHILHLTTAKELALFSTGPVKNKRISAEACVHYLHFDDSDYAEKGSLIKCNPAIKTAQDREALTQALLDDRLDLIATDHAPHTREEKQNLYFKAPSGLPLVQYALLTVLEKYHDGRFTLPFIAKKTSHAVADCFSIKERGFVREGYWADLVLVDLNKTTQAEHAAVMSKCGWTPFDGYQFRSSIETTIVSGKLAWHQGVIGDDVRGKRIEFER